MIGMGKTVIFEERYGVNVNDFSTTEEIDEVIEKQKGRKLEIVKIDDHGIVPSRGNVFKIRKLAQEARSIEMESVGLSPMASIDKYKEVVKSGYELIDKRDNIKISEIKSLKRFISTKEFLVGIVIGVFGGLISGYLLSII